MYYTNNYCSIKDSSKCKDLLDQSKGLIHDYQCIYSKLLKNDPTLNDGKGGTD